MDPSSQQSTGKRSRLWVRVLKRALMLLYALIAGCTSVWVVSFTPSEGPPLMDFVPTRAGVVLHVVHGANVLETVAGHPAMQELFVDPDFCLLVRERMRRRGQSNTTATGATDATACPPIPQQLENRIAENEEQLPFLRRWLAKKLLPPRLSSLYPFAGREVVVAQIVPELDQKDSAVKTLFLTRVSGGRGLLARMAGNSHLAIDLGNGNTTAFYDLGGDVIAIGTRGVGPGSALSGAPFLEHHADAGTDNDSVEFARLTVRPLVLQGKRAENENLDESPIAPYLDSLARSIAQSIFRAPTPADWFALTETPRSIRLSLCAKDGQVVARGEIDGGVPPLPKAVPDPAAEQPVKKEPGRRPYLQGVLPVDPKACFLTYIVDALKPVRNEKENKLGFKTRQKRWLNILSGLKRDKEHPMNLDMDEDFWPAFSHAINIRMEEPPPELSPTGYGLLRMAIAFDGKREGARPTFDSLLEGQWDIHEASPGKDAHMPYLRLFASDTEDRYVLATGEISAPTITISQRSVSLTSDAGSFALVGVPNEAKHPAISEPPRSFFLRIDGPRFAPNVETFRTQMFNDEEKRLGTQEFVAKHPNHTAQVAMARKLTGLLGDFDLDVKPTANGKGELTIRWKPGTIKVPSAKHDAAPPPQNPNVPSPNPVDNKDTPNVAPPPPPQD